MSDFREELMLEEQVLLEKKKIN